MNKINFTNEQVQEIIADYKTIKNMVKVGKKFNVTQPVIRRILVENGITILAKRASIERTMSEEKQNEICNAYFNSKLPLTEICKRFKVSSCTINKYADLYIIKHPELTKRDELTRYNFATTRAKRRMATDINPEVIASSSAKVEARFNKLGENIQWQKLSRETLMDLAQSLLKVVKDLEA